MHRFRVLITILLLMAGLCAQIMAEVTPPQITYDISVSLDANKKLLLGKERIVYVSGADIPLKELYIHLYANAYRSRESMAVKELEHNIKDFTLAYAKKEKLGFVQIDTLLVNGVAADYDIDDTSLRIRLRQPLQPADSMVIDIDFVTKIPGLPHRFTHVGNNYSIAQWYPKMAVYDKSGWHADQYHAIGEFYGDFATFNVSMTIPQEYYVGASGQLVDSIGGNNAIPTFMTSKKTIDSLRKDISKKIESGVLTPTKTLVYRAEKMHDFAWVASPDYVKSDTVWNGITVTALTFRDAFGPYWKHLREYATNALEFFSSQVGAYPYTHLTVAEAYCGTGTGMEYPALAMVDPSVNIPLTRQVEIVTVHEVGHNWWYGMVANDELNEPWLDESFTEYYTIQYAKDKYENAETLHLPVVFKSLLQVPYDVVHEQSYLQSVNSGTDRVIAQPACNYSNFMEYSATVYCKGAEVLDMLRYVVGDSLFTEIVRTYFKEYQYKHPHTEDFVRVAERVSGQDLNWFFDEWLQTTKTCDYAIGHIRKSRDSLSESHWRTSVEVLRKGNAVMPVEVNARLADDTQVNQTIFVRKTKDTTVFVTTSPVKHIKLDPNYHLPEANRLNNENGFLPPLKVMGLWQSLAPSSTKCYGISINPSLWYNKVDKTKVGLTVLGGYAQFYHLTNLSCFYGTATRKFNYGAGYSTPLPPKNSKIDFDVNHGDGISRLSMGISLRNHPDVVSMIQMYYPIVAMDIGLRYSHRFDERYYSSKWYSLGKTTIISAKASYLQKSYHGRTFSKISFEQGTKTFGSDFEFTKIFWTVNQDIRVVRTGELVFNVRGAFGRVFGDSPKHEKLSAGRGVPASSTDPVGSLLIRGNEGGLRGYQDEAILGTKLYAANIELKSRWLSVPLLQIEPIFFFDAGKVSSSETSQYLNRTLYDAGIEFRLLGMCSLSVPLWLSESPADEKNWKLRFIFSFNTEL